LWATAGGENLSYLGFLIDRLTTATAADLRRLPESGGISGCTLLAALQRLGTYLPPDVQDRSVERLRRHMVVGRLARFGAGIDIDVVNQGDPGAVPMAESLAAMAIDDSRVDAAKALLAFAESRAEGLAALREMTGSPRLVSRSGRVAAAVAMIRAGDETGLDLMVALASDPGWGDDERLGVAWQLARLHPRRGLDLLTGWVDARGAGDFWFKAALVLEAIDGPRGLERLRDIAGDPAVPPPLRINAAYLVALRNDPRGAEDLLRFAGDPDLDERLRVAAVHLAARAGHPAAAGARDELARAPGLSRRGRRSRRRLDSSA
jgi:hypothetical protein